ncbi:MAG TPA: FHA domain-containing protein, partial [Polyangiales bacterium]|nr:FHA domain-containing protein [Polyangiales bacterium]
METRRVSISVQRGDRCDQFELQAGELRVGSASHCDVRLGPDEAAPEQLSISAEPRGLYISALTATPLVLFRGAPLTHVSIDSSAVLELGSLRLGVQLVAGQARPDRQRELLKNARLLAMLLGTLLLGYSILNEPEAPSALARPIAPPALFAQLAPTCRESERAAA